MLIFHIFMVNALKTPFYDMKIIKIFKWFTNMIQIMWNRMWDGQYKFHLCYGSIFQNVSQASHIKKLTNINYVTWSVKLDMLLIHLELFGVVDDFKANSRSNDLAFHYNHTRCNYNTSKRGHERMELPRFS